MEVREFAEQVLFGTTLEDKLIDGGRYRRGHPGSAIPAPGEPGRPRSLALGGWNDRDRVRFREVRGFHSEKERGLVLHFFANHELLAIELMALALLKFPDAPEKFRRGLYGILREEQEHLRLYIERMRGIGVEFGEIPVSDFFWRCISPVETPIEFVTRLSLTLEQANLDYAPYYASVYGELGDDETARLMQRIYRDEIGHVKHGLTWFNSWRDPALGEWEAYTRTLAPPLDPGRAKGIGFNAEGRRKAGLSEAFIGELQVHSQSRGRPPSVFWFNPACDRCAGLDGVQTPPKWMAQVAEDLETVPALACAAGDVVLVGRRPRREHLSELQAAGLETPEFALVDGASGLEGHPLAERRLGALRPWGVAPDSEQLLAPLKGSVAGPGKVPVWSSALRRLYSKEWSAALLAEFLEGRREDWLCGAGVVGQRCGSMGDVRQALDLLEERGWSRAVIKALFGAAGRGQVRISRAAELGEAEDPLKGAKRGRVERLLAEQGAVVVEPLLEGVADLSAQYEVGADGKAVLLGITRFVTDGRGQYLGSFLHRKVDGLDEQVRRFLYGDGRDSRRLRRLCEELAGQMEPGLAAAGFSGPLGVDALVYRDRGGLRLKPVIEVNPRMTMGRVALQLARRVHAAGTALWLMLRVRDIEEAGFENAGAFAGEMRRRHPVEMTAEGDLVSRGVLFTTDPQRAKAFLTLLVAAESLEECKAWFEPWGGRLSEWTRRC